MSTYVQLKNGKLMVVYSDNIEEKTMHGYPIEREFYWDFESETCSVWNYDDIICKFSNRTDAFKALEKNKRPKFKNKDGSLTMYALACGYIEGHKVKGYDVNLSFEHDSCFDIMIFDGYERLFWLQRSSLGEARKLVSNVKGIILRNKSFCEKIKELEDKYMGS